MILIMKISSNLQAIFQLHFQWKKCALYLIKYIYLLGLDFFLAHRCLTFEVWTKYKSFLRVKRSSLLTWGVNYASLKTLYFLTSQRWQFVIWIICLLACCCSCCHCCCCQAAMSGATTFTRMALIIKLRWASHNAFLNSDCR